MTALRVERCLPDGFLAEALRADARAGLTASPKVLPPKWFYDERGSELFEKITHLDEYYPTRVERSILREHAGQIAAATRARTLVELGAGAADKTRLLLDALREEGTLASFVPVDVSEAALIEAAHRVEEGYPGLSVTAVVSDFEEHLGLPDADGARLVVFLGGTIGNLLPDQRAEFFASLRSRLHPGDAFLLGTDLVKDPEVLVAAYDDPAGVTAAFNKNILSVLNAALGARLRPRCVRPRRALGRGPGMDRDAAPVAGRSGGDAARDRPRGGVRRRRGDADRGVGQVPPGRDRRGTGGRRVRDAVLVDRQRAASSACPCRCPPSRADIGSLPGAPGGRPGQDHPVPGAQPSGFQWAPAARRRLGASLHPLHARGGQPQRADQLRHDPVGVDRPAAEQVDRDQVLLRPGVDGQV